MRRVYAVALVVIVACGAALAQLPRITEQEQRQFGEKRAELYKWAPWQFLVGTWKGDARGIAGTGPGEFTFKPDLDGKILVTTNAQQFGATRERAAFTYRSLMVIYLEGLDTRAALYDNEGHVLHYKVEFAENPRRVTFISEVVPYAPRFRFSYTDRGDGKTLDVAFETAPPDAPAKYLAKVQGVVHRVE